MMVSTHSRLKAAEVNESILELNLCFNTQPPEGGCKNDPMSVDLTLGFNTQPPEGGWDIELPDEIEVQFQHTAA